MNDTARANPFGGISAQCAGLNTREHLDNFSIADAVSGSTWQFEREGYFCRDVRAGERLVFNRTIALRDTWARQTGVEG